MFRIVVLSLLFLISCIREVLAFLISPRSLGKESVNSIYYSDSNSDLKYNLSKIAALIHQQPIIDVDYIRSALGENINDTSVLAIAFMEAISSLRPIRLSGNYRVNAPILEVIGGDKIQLDIICIGHVYIEVELNSQPFDTLIYFNTNDPNLISITGGSLAIEMNNRVATAISIGFQSQQVGGDVNIETPLTIKNIFNNDVNSTVGNFGILINGNYDKIYLNRPSILNLSRINPKGVCKGIFLTGFSGTVRMVSPFVQNVTCPDTGLDADGIAVFGRNTHQFNSKRLGSVIIEYPIFIDCRGRSFKSQCSDVFIMRPKVKRQFILTIENGHDFDFQTGNGIIVEPDFEYKLNGDISPIGRRFYPVAFQQNIEDQSMLSQSVGGVLRSDVVIPAYCLLLGNTANAGQGVADSVVKITNLRAFKTNVTEKNLFSRCFVELHIPSIHHKINYTLIQIQNVRGPIGATFVGYTGVGSDELSINLMVSINDCSNEIESSFPAYLFAPISGRKIRNMKYINILNNYGFAGM